VISRSLRPAAICRREFRPSPGAVPRPLAQGRGLVHPPAPGATGHWPSPPSSQPPAGSRDRHPASRRPLRSCQCRLRPGPKSRRASCSAMGRQNVDRKSIGSRHVHRHEIESSALHEVSDERDVAGEPVSSLAITSVALCSRQAASAFASSGRSETLSALDLGELHASFPAPAVQIVLDSRPLRREAEPRSALAGGRNAVVGDEFEFPLAIGPKSPIGTASIATTLVVVNDTRLDGRISRRRGCRPAHAGVDVVAMSTKAHAEPSWQPIDCRLRRGDSNRPLALAYLSTTWPYWRDITGSK